VGKKRVKGQRGSHERQHRNKEKEMARKFRKENHQKGGRGERKSCNSPGRGATKKKSQKAFKLKRASWRGLTGKLGKKEEKGRKGSENPKLPKGIRKKKKNEHQEQGAAVQNRDDPGIETGKRRLGKTGHRNRGEPTCTGC